MKKSYIVILCFAIMALIIDNIRLRSLAREKDVVKITSQAAEKASPLQPNDVAAGKDLVTKKGEDPAVLAKKKEDAIKARQLLDEAFMKASSVQTAIGPELRTARSRREVEKALSPYLSELNLDPTKLLAVKNILAERTSTAADTRELARKQRLTRDETEALIEDAEKKLNDDLVNLVGQAAFDKIAEISKMQPELQLIQNTYALDMSYSGVPLNPSQVKSLAGLITKYSGTDPETRRRRTSIANTSTNTSEIDQEVLAKAATFLDEKQLAVLRSDLAVATKGAIAGTVVNAQK